MKAAEIKALIKMDIDRWDGRSFYSLYLSKAEFRLVFRLRICQYLSNKHALFPLFIIERLLFHRIKIKCGCDIPNNVKIGGGFQILHSWGVVINSQAIIGDNCTILTGSLIGKTKTGVPIIGNDVYIGAHAAIIGGITVGNGAVIGAGAVVVDNVPPYAVMIGEKAHVLKERNSSTLS